MSCFHPLKCYISRHVNKETGKRSMTFDIDSALIAQPQKIACGRCIGCRLDRSLQWAVRCMHEASLHDQNCFITLTFNEKNIGDGNLRVEDFQKFMKRLRKKIFPQKVRFFHCGEYGAKFQRPHHHACLFGYDFPDKIKLPHKGGSPLYISQTLMELWPFGHSTVGQVTLESASYVARYVLKKWSENNLTGEELYEAMQAFKKDCNADLKKAHYKGKKEEYVTMSRRPGIGQAWYEQFKNDIYPSDTVVINNKQYKIPKYYDLKYEIEDQMKLIKIKQERIKRHLNKKRDQEERLKVKEKILMKNIKENQQRRYEK